MATYVYVYAYARNIRMYKYETFSKQYSLIYTMKRFRKHRPNLEKLTNDVVRNL